MDNKISVELFAEKYNPILTRRNKKMSVSYIYRLIRQDLKDELTRPLWFKYELTGEKDRIYIILQ